MMNELQSRAMLLISKCDDPDKLKRIASNARRSNDAAVERAANLKLFSVLPAAEPGTLEHDVWRSIYALEATLKSERGKTTLLTRTRQKIARHGEQRTVEDLVLGKLSEGFEMLIQREMADHTFEAVAMRHENRFSPKVLFAASKRLAWALSDDHLLSTSAAGSLIITETTVSPRPTTIR